MKTLNWVKIDKYLNVLFCIGAAVVIFGALAKIQHWQSADLFITTGLLSEVGIFLIMGVVEAKKPKENAQQGEPINRINQRYDTPQLTTVDITGDIITFRDNLKRMNNMMENILNSNR